MMKVYIDPPYAKQENEKLIQKLEDLDIVKSDYCSGKPKKEKNKWKV